MKKSLFYILILLTFLFSSSFITNRVLAADMSIRDFVSLLITIGVIPANKIPAINTWLASVSPIVATNSNLNSNNAKLNISGNWSLTFTAGSSNYTSKSALSQNGNVYSGTAFDLNSDGSHKANYSVTGSVTGNNLAEKWTRTDGYMAYMSGTMNAESTSYHGTWKDTVNNVGSFIGYKSAPSSSGGSSGGSNSGSNNSSGGSGSPSGQTSLIPVCLEANWTSVISPVICPSSGSQTKSWTKIGTCTGGITHPATETISCTYQAPRNGSIAWTQNLCKLCTCHIQQIHICQRSDKQRPKWLS